MSKNDLKLRLKFAQIVYCKRATMKYEIIRKPMILERVEANLLKSTHCCLERGTTRYRQFF